MAKIVIEYVHGRDRLILARLDVQGTVESVVMDMTQEELKTVQNALKQKCETIVVYDGEDQEQIAKINKEIERRCGAKIPPTS